MDKPTSDTVTHGEMQRELQFIRTAIALIAYRLSNELGTRDAARIMELLKLPEDR